MLHKHASIVPVVCHYLMIVEISESALVQSPKRWLLVHRDEDCLNLEICMSSNVVYFLSGDFKISHGWIW